MFNARDFIVPPCYGVGTVKLCRKLFIEYLVYERAFARARNTRYAGDNAYWETDGNVF